ncbi:MULTISPECIES: tetratricopeptide repeat protein [unclassified Rhodanobacter]|uniref:tetratricopeptide repeat protein n=1 Tax=unclassified Rhodanobacter TaxID=2621553 RepID=UPI0016087972|nr:MULTISPECIES: tetratricopeptide repeat protein [unclassified Rhodanobacter]MBB6242273.1 hypothetical protein [Rhodanobacter sp. MP1X3]MBB6245519.1 hypothetical protein [Rhodanobacter sp. A1T4]
MNMKIEEAREKLESACLLYETGERTKSVHLFLEAARLGNIQAQVNLANIYDEGDGLRKNFEKARFWYKKATSSGSAEAAYNLGISYKNRKNVRWSAYWLSIAQAMGDEDAKEQLRNLKKLAK